MAYSRRRTAFAKRRRATIARNKAVLTVTNVIKAIIAERGLLTEAAYSLGVNRTTLREFMATNPPCSVAYNDAREGLGDLAEKKLYELIEAGDLRAITYYLSTVHRKRGYGLKLEDAVDFTDRKHIHVETINVVAIPPGHFLQPGEVIDAVALPAPPEPEGGGLFS